MTCDECGQAEATDILVVDGEVMELCADCYDWLTDREPTE